MTPATITSLTSAPGAVHLRAGTSVRRVMGWTAVATLPCVVAALFHTGRQACLGLVRLGVEAPAGWRTDVLARLGLPAEPGHAGSCLLLGALYLLPLLAVAWLTGAGWERLFSVVRRRPRVPGLAPTALVFTLLLPPAAPLWQVALGMSFAVVMTRELFGGTGMGFVNAPAAGLAFLMLAYPDAMASAALWQGVDGYAGTTAFHDVAGTGAAALQDAGITQTSALLGAVPGMLGTTSAAACLLGGALLVLRGILPWRVPVGALAGVFVGTLVLGGSPVAGLGWSWHVLLGGFAFGAVFLAADPATAPLTHGGRWAAGLVVGFLTVLVRSAHAQHPDGVVFAVLFAGVFAPLFDHAAVWLQLRRRRWRHG